MEAGEIIQAPKANVMAVTSVGPARISQSNDEFPQILAPLVRRNSFILGLTQCIIKLVVRGKAMAVTVSIINLKGGVGKSTLTMTLAEYLSFRFGKRVLLIDMDAQANLSYIMVPYRWIETQEKNQKTIYHFFQSSLSGQRRPIADFVARPPLMVSNINRVFRTDLNRSEQTLDMVISTPSVAQLEEDLLKLWEAKKPMPANLRSALEEGLNQVQDQYDVVLIDCPPGLSLFTSTALIASDFFVSPIIPEPLSLEGVRLAQDRARELGREYGCKVEFAGVILNIVKHYRKQHQITASEIYGARSSLLKPFQFWLPDNERLRGLGEFEIDEERIRDGWAAGVDSKFWSVYSKYSVGYLLTNPATGALSQMRQAEGDKYRLHEGIERLVEEFRSRVGLSP